MIQCPICQVVNEDTALFCAECGQRFGPAASEPPRPQSAPPQSAPQAQPLAAQVEPGPKQKRVKLHSPILGGSDEPAEDEGYSKPQLSRLRGTSPGGGGRPGAPSQATEGRTTGGRKHLRSPLLGGADDDFDDEEEPVARSKPSPRKTAGGGLRSPLLGEGGDDFDDGDDDEPPVPRSPTAKKSKLRSPLLGDEDDDDDDYIPAQRGRKNRPSGAADSPRSPSPSGGLRSPLLGGGDDESPPLANRGRSTGGLRSPLLKGGDDYDDDDDEPIRPSPSRGPKPAGGRQKLHSPILGDSDAYYDDDDQDDDDDDGNPDVLRSPLLAAKKKRSIHPPQAPGQQMQAPPVPGQMPGGHAQGGMPHPAAYNPTQPQGQPGYGAPPAVPPAQPRADLLVAEQPPLPGQVPPNYSQQGMPGMAPGISQQGMPPGAPQPPSMPPGLSQQGMPGMPTPPAMPQGLAPPQTGPSIDFAAPQAISQSGVHPYPQQAPAPAAPLPAVPHEQVKLVSHTASRSDVSALPQGSDEKYAGLAELNKQIDKKEEEIQIGPADRRGTERRKGGRDRRLSSPLVDGGRRFDDDDSDSGGPTLQRSSGGVHLIVPVLIAVGLLCKGVFFQQVLPTNTLGQLPWYFWLDQAGTGIALFLCLIIVVMSGGKK